MMSRGNQGRPIFRGDEDRKLFLQTVAEGCEKTGWQIHAYALMNNHYHMLLETPEANLVTGMKWFQGTYTQRFNARHKVSGHLYQGRYKAVLIDGSQDDYFQVVSTYIHLNPARAGLIQIGKQRLKTYRWSSYPHYLSRRSQRPEWLRVDRVLGSLGIQSDDAVERKRFEAYVEGRVTELGEKGSREELNGEWKAIRRGWYLGGPSFLERLEDFVDKALKGKARGSFSGEAKQAHDEAAAETLLSKGMVGIGMAKADFTHLPKGAPEKQALAWWLRKRTVVSRGWISRRLHMGDESRVTQAVAANHRTKDRRALKLQQSLDRLVS